MATTTQLPTGGFDPRAALRGSEPVEPYPLLRQRVPDHSGGRRDGKLGIPALGDGPLPSDVLLTPWLRRHRSRFEESAYRELLAAQAAAAPMLAEVADLLAALTALIEEERARRTDLAALPEQPPEERLEVRGPGETHAPAAIVRMRNTREWAGERAAARAAVEAATRRHVEIEVRLARLQSDLESLFDTACTRARRARAHAERRAHVYLRALVRRHPERPRLEPLVDGQTIPVPEWVLRPCPWTGHLPFPAA